MPKMTKGLMFINLILIGVLSLFSPNGACTEDTAALENILPDYSNVRGLNYIGSWGNTSIKMWSDHYSSTQVDAELGYMRSIGVNAIRVWMNHWRYFYEPATYIARFTDFLSRCENYGIYVMPVLWDSIRADPSLTPWFDYGGWYSNPGPQHLDPTMWIIYESYINDVVNAGKNSPALLMWDIWNEPAETTLTHSMIVFTCVKVKQADPVHPITIGFAHPENNLVNNLVDYIDVVSFHEYYLFRENLEVRVEEARNFDKPVICSEIGWPGYAMRYEDMLRYCDDCDLGFFMFQTMIVKDVAFPFFNSTGIFFPDGEVRGDDVSTAFIDLAYDQGGYVLGGEPDVKGPDPNDPYWFYQTHVQEGFGAPEVIELVFNWYDPQVGYCSPKNPYVDPFNQANYNQGLLLAAWSMLDLDAIAWNDFVTLYNYHTAYEAAIVAGNYLNAHNILMNWGPATGAFLQTAGIGANP